MRALLDLPNGQLSAFTPTALARPARSIWDRRNLADMRLMIMQANLSGGLESVTGPPDRPGALAGLGGVASSWIEDNASHGCLHVALDELHTFTHLIREMHCRVPILFWSNSACWLSHDSRNLGCTTFINTGGSLLLSTQRCATPAEQTMDRVNRDPQPKNHSDPRGWWDLGFTTAGALPGVSALIFPCACSKKMKPRQRVEAPL